MADLRADEIDVVGIGNALVDVLSHESDESLARHGLTKGAMHLIDEPRAAALYDAMGPGVEVSGGSAANTIVGVASLGGRAQYIGKVRNDQLGQVFTHDMQPTQRSAMNSGIWGARWLKSRVAAVPGGMMLRATAPSAPSPASSVCAP